MTGSSSLSILGTGTVAGMRHLTVLDGWRGVSIICVLLAHLAPLATWGNIAIGVVGMVFFFTLSGFLITSLLLRPDATVGSFLIRRLFRIVPLAWAYLLIVFCFQDATTSSQIAHFLFYANIPPYGVRLATDHLWSLCVEVQFYIGVAILFAIAGARGLLLLPLLAFAFTGLRIMWHGYATSITWLRIDEVLAGCALALVYHGKLGRVGEHLRRGMSTASQPILLVLLLLSSFLPVQSLLWLDYFRPYFSALLIGATILNPSTRLVSVLTHRVFIYLAETSYAAYVIHLGLVYTWLGSGGLVEKYAKRPLLLFAVFLFAHVITRYFEQPMIEYGRRLSVRFKRATPASTPAA